MGLRFKSVKELLKVLAGSDVVMVEEEQRPTPVAAKLLKRAMREAKVLEDSFAANWAYLGGMPLEREYKFHPTRKWRFDFAHVPTKTAFEIMGGLYQAESGHRSKAGVSRDYEKMNAAQALGWQVFSLTSENLKDAPFIEGLIAQVKAKSEQY